MDRTVLVAPQPRRRRSALLALSLLAALGGGPGVLHAAGVEAAQVIGVNHVDGLYNFTGADFLNEGAAQVQALGSTVIKVFLVPRGVARVYSFNSNWPPPDTDVVALAAHPHFRDLFARPFSTFVLVIDPQIELDALVDGLDPSEAETERDQMYRLASYLLTTYAGSGKTFVLQNWEGDHLLRSGLRGIDPDRVRLQAMTDWWNLRQEGVERARREHGEDGVEVLHAAEVNDLGGAMAGRVSATNDIVPFTACDLYSYSSWDLGFVARDLVRALDHLASRAPDNARFGARNLYVGELGVPRELVRGEAERYDRIRSLLDAAVSWGVRYALYWQVYCNESYRELRGRPRSRDLRGFWLVPPEGKRVALWDTLSTEVRATLFRGALLSGSGFAMAATDSGTLAARPFDPANARQVVTVKDWNGGDLFDGEQVSLLVHGGGYLSAQPDGALVVRDVAPRSSERFVVSKVAGTGRVTPGDAVTLRSLRTRRYIGVAGARPGPIRAGRTTPAGAETFRLQDLE